MKLSKQSMTVFMVLLQKCLLEEKDYSVELGELEFELENNELFVINPPKSIKFSQKFEENEDA